MSTLCNTWPELIPGVCNGDKAALDSMSGMLYKELKKLASAQIRRETPGHTLQATALVHEVYLRLASWSGDIEKTGRSHFLALAVTVMRQILVHHARRRNAAKRGSGARKVTLLEGYSVSADGSREVVALDDALNHLSATDARKGKIIELRYFGGLSDAEIAEVLDISISTVGREVRVGLAMLYRLLQGAPKEPAAQLRYSNS